jgi:hypothetical protein
VESTLALAAGTSYYPGTNPMSAIIDYLASLADDAEEVDLSSFERIENLDDETWDELNSNKTKKRVKLPPSLVTIRSLAFDSSSQLAHVTFPSSLRSIEDHAFFDCTGLAMRDLKLPESLEELGEHALESCSGLTGKLSTHITGRSSFAWCTGLTELDLANCKEIKYGCFMGCTGLIGQLKFPLSMQSIGQYAFENCRGLTGALIFPPFVSFIHPSAFWGCSGMKGKMKSIKKHFIDLESWKIRGNVLMTLIEFDEEYRRVVEKNGGRLHSALSNSFLSDYSREAQLIYKAAAHVDGTDNLANGICRLIISFLPMKRKYYGTQLSNDEVDALGE